jgi:protein-disulfide isomerase
VIISRQWLSVILIAAVIGGLGVYRFVVLKSGHAMAANLQAHPQVKGGAGAAVSIVEFTDFQCPACATANAFLDDAMKKYDGKIRVEHKHFPLAMHAHSMRASVFAQCAADQGKFWAFNDVLFKSQKSWSGMVSVDAYFSELAVSLGMNGARLSACVNSPEAAAKVRRDMDEGKSRGVKATPTFFVNDKFVVGGPALTMELSQRLEKK